MKPAMPRDTRFEVTIFEACSLTGAPLPAHVGIDGVIYSEWEPTFAERQAISDGARVQVWATNSGRVHIQTEGIEEEQS